MIWNVEGADASTGTERVVSVTADSAEEAERLASRQGLLVSAVFESTIAAAIPFAEAAAAAVPVAAVERVPAEPLAAPAGPAPTVQYKGLYTKSPEASRRERMARKWQPWRWTWRRQPYFHLKLASRVLAVLAGLSYVSGVIAMLLGVIGFFQRLELSSFSFLGALYDFFTLVSPLIAGALLHAAAAACDALRDMALAAMPRATDVSIEP